MKPENKSNKKLFIRVTCIVLAALMLASTAYLAISGILALLA